MIATLELGPRAGHEDALRSWLTGTALPAATERPGVTAGHLLEGDAGVSTAAKSDEKKLLATPDALVRWVVLVEGIDPVAIESAGRDLLERERPRRPRRHRRRHARVLPPAARVRQVAGRAARRIEP